MLDVAAKAIHTIEVHDAEARAARRVVEAEPEHHDAACLINTEATA